MVTASLDGFIRLYDPRFELIKKLRVHGRFEPVMVRFSPDGAKIAVGSYSTQIAVLSTTDLSLLYMPANQALGDQKNLPGVAWSPDGKLLYACGDFTGSGETPLYRWEDEGRGEMTRLRTARLRVTGLEPLREGRVVYTAEDPVLGLLDATGNKTWFRATEIADFRDIGAALRVSRNAAAVQFAYRRGGEDLAHFALLDTEDVVPGPLDAEQSLAPITEAPGLAITDWKDNLDPKLNGKPLQVDRKEYSRSLAIAPDGQSFLIGYEWTLRLFDHEGKPLWRVPLPQVAWGVVISGDGKLAVAALSDGTIRWYGMGDGQERFALFPYDPPNGVDRQWIAWTPEGFYNSSEYGDNYVGWHLNRGRDQAADFYRAYQFERILYRPTEVAEYFSCLLALKVGDCEALASPDLTRITANAPPRFDPLTITLKHVLPDRARAVLRLHAQKNRLPMEDYTVFLNGIPITPGSERRLGGGARRDLIKELEIDLYQRENTVRVEVSSARSVGVTERYFNVPDLAREARPAPGNLYLLAVGVNRFPKLDAGWQLHYAAKDAIGIKHAFEALGGGLYKQVRSKILSDAEGDLPDKDRIVEALEFIKTARAQDTVVVFLSSHGLSDPEQNYYLVPRNALPEEIRQIEQGQGEAVPSLIGWETIFEALRNTAGRRLLIVDSCKAKSIEGRFGAQWLKKRSASARFALMVSSKGTENSLEDGRYGHGIFTYALLQGLMTACDGRCEGAITLWRLFDYIVPTVNRLRALDAGQQTPQLSAPEELRNMVLARPTGSWTRELQRIWNYLRELWRGGN